MVVGTQLHFLERFVSYTTQDVVSLNWTGETDLTHADKSTFITFQTSSNHNLFSLTDTQRLWSVSELLVLEPSQQYYLIIM